jgi:hypothetical protein
MYREIVACPFKKFVGTGDGVAVAAGVGVAPHPARAAAQTIANIIAYLRLGRDAKRLGRGSSTQARE